MENRGEVVIYKTGDSGTQIEVKFQQDTVWLTQSQIVKLFQSSKANISEHVKHIFVDGELEKKQTVRKFRTVKIEGKKQVSRELEYYNLDLIISVGYRVNSRRGIQFRQWATKRLKEYLIKGYAINENRLKEKQQQFTELKRTIKILENVVSSKDLNYNEVTGLLKVITDYTYALDTLDKYDHQTLEKPKKKSKEKFRITYKEAIDAIGTLKEKFGGTSLFGKEKDNSFRSSLENIYLTFQRKELYKGAENKAAHLLYFVVKNHSFADGNKRIAAFLFILFLERNNLLYNAEGAKNIEDNTLVALTLMVAESKPDEKEMMIKVILNLMQKKY